ncbi:hypothetical protein JTE90_010277 [Oedothorax gibbosus]|uniref:Uncharacterized protein n=1 Tax=Oedothorax gibbosus TaxID=931172 RepID=A0AAV6U535_9ARAC|nr:hypothetical protein JTE90_010277 [Oedothorax gibbosus]
MKQLNSASATSYPVTCAYVISGEVICGDVMRLLWRIRCGGCGGSGVEVVEDQVWRWWRIRCGGGGGSGLEVVEDQLVKTLSKKILCVRIAYAATPGAVAQVPIAGDATNLTTRSCTRIRPKSKQHLVIQKSLNQRLLTLST